MLHLTNLTINHKTDLRPLIADLTLTIAPGDKVALIGEEGSGKSSLLQLLAEPMAELSYATVTGDIRCSFRQIAHLRQSLTAADLALPISDFLYQDLDFALFDFNRLYQLAAQLGFPAQKFEETVQTVGQLSGGERLKLQLVKLLATGPDLLLLDEPSADLDLASLEWLETFLRQTDLTIISISHDETLLSHVATAIVHLQQVKKKHQAKTQVAQTSYDSYLEERAASFERDSQLAKKERANHKKQMDQLRQIKSSLHHQLNTTKDATAGRLLAKKMKAIQSQERRFDRQAEGFTDFPDQLDTIALSLSHIQPLPAQKILWQLDGQLPTGQRGQLLLRGQDRLAITGTNGVGKTSLLKQLAQDLASKPDLIVTYMPQAYEDLLPTDQTALDWLSELAEPETIRTLLANLQFTREEIHHPTSQLSGGQKAKLFLARAGLTGSQVLLLDEPTRHLSPTSQQAIRDLLRHYPGAIVAVSHDRALLADLDWDIYQLTQTHLLKT